MLEPPIVRRALTALSKAEAAKAAMELLEDDLFGKQRALDLAIFTKIERGETVSAEECYQLVFQKYAVWSVLRSLTQKLKAGQGASQIIAPMMEESNGP